MLWSVAIPLLVMAERLGLTRVAPDVYEQAASRLDEYGVSHPRQPMVCREERQPANLFPAVHPIE